MPNSTLHQVWPESAADSPEHKALAALRAQIDAVDDQLLELFQKRLDLAGQVGRAKDAPTGPHTKLRPDREKAVLAHVHGRAAAPHKEAVTGLWREIVGWGLAQQGQLKVQVWSPNEPARAFDGARQRFGRAAEIRMVHDAEAALRFASDGGGVAVLAVNNDTPWWIGLRKEWAHLSVFEGFGGEVPSAFAVGPIDPAALPGGRRVVVSAGGDAGDGAGARRWGLHTHHGWTLALTDARIAPGGPEGCVGAVG
jgi:chorismate mutase / prephenate dehydratase